MKTIKKMSTIGIGVLVIASALVFVAATGGSRIIIGDTEDNNGSYTATISSENASRIALTAVSGDVVSVELENEDGYLVYGVHIQNADGTWDIKVDAGTGELLKIDADNGTEVIETE